MPQASIQTRPPNLLKVLLEWRSLSEFSMSSLAVSLGRILPKGDGHPVLVLPGFMANHYSTVRLRRFIRLMGYRVYDWKLGRNIGPVGQMEPAVLERIRYITLRNGRKPTLVGWSLGGVYARVIAHLAPETVRAIITLGSPVRFPHRSTADTLYHRMRGDFQDPEYLQQLADPPPVPATAIHSRLDGIVNWQACMAQDSATSENIRVYGSHLGMGYNPTIYFLLADRLSQAEGDWQRFRLPAALAASIATAVPCRTQTGFLKRPVESSA